MHMIENGNVAAALGVKLAGAQVIAAYPITPQTPLTEKLSEFIEAGEMKAQYVPVESEHSALAACIAASSTGARAFTATSANGLLYMHEQIHWAAGARLPIVMCVVNRAVGAPWNIWNDHQDSISQRDTGWIQMYASDHQQIIDGVLKAFAIAEATSIPVMLCYDGYLLSHTYMPFEVPEEEKVGAVPEAVQAGLCARSGRSGQPQHRHPARRAHGRRRRVGPRLHGDPLPAAGGPARRADCGPGDRGPRSKRSSGAAAMPFSSPTAATTRNTSWWDSVRSPTNCEMWSRCSGARE